MFDFSLHGLAMMLSGVVVHFFCRACGLQPIKKVKVNNEKHQEESNNATENAIPRNLRKSLIVLITLVPIIFLTGIGIIHPSIAFGVVTLIWVVSNVLPYKTAISHINIPIIIFLGSMFGISAVLEETGALNAAVSLISPLFTSLPPFLLILIFPFAYWLGCN